MKNLFILLLIFSFIQPAFCVTQEQLNSDTILDEKDYKKMPNAWHWTALYPPVYALVGIGNGIRIKNEKKKIREHNEEVLKLREVNSNIKNLTCLKMKYIDDNLQRSVQKTEYFFIDTTNKIVLDKYKKPVFKIQRFDDNIIKFITKTPTYYDGYDILQVYIVDRYTGNLQTGKERVSNNVFTKFNTALTTGLYDIPIGEGTGSVTKVDETEQKF